MYAYVAGDPINRADITGLCNVVIGGFTQSSSSASSEALNAFASDNGSIQAFPYGGGNIQAGLLSVASPDLLNANGATLAAAAAIYAAYVEDPNTPIDITTFSGGAQAFSQAIARYPGFRAILAT